MRKLLDIIILMLIYPAVLLTFLLTKETKTTLTESVIKKCSN